MFICFNANFIPASEPVLTVQNPSYKWGDGLFETMKICKGNVLLAQYHFDRLFSGLSMLHFNEDDHFNKGALLSQIITLCEKNNCAGLARVRLAVFRNEQNRPGYTIEALPLLPEYNQCNEEGWKLGVYSQAKKQNDDAFANLKSANHLPYVLAGIYAKEEQLDEVLLLNTSGQICDGSRTNVFLISGKEIHTPGLHQGCVTGVMRRHLVMELKKAGWVVKQEEISENDLLQADEVFLTNAIHGLRWVRCFKEKNFGSAQSFAIYQKHIRPIFL